MQLTEIDIDPQAHSVVEGRQAPFDALGVDVRDATTPDEVMSKAGLLGWNVQLRKIQTVEVPPTIEIDLERGVGAVPARPSLPVKDLFAVVGNDPKHPGQERAIGVVGSKYQTHQPEELLDMLGALVNASGGKAVAAADYYGNGKQIFITIELPVGITVGGVDPVHHYVTVFSSFDGSMSITPVMHNLRVMCANMKNQAIADSDGRFARIRHSGDLGAKLAAAREVMGIAWEGMREFDQRSEIMFSKKMTDAEFDRIVSQVWPLDANPSEQAKRADASRRIQLKEILHGPTCANIAGTAWAGFNAISEYSQWSSKNATTNHHRGLTTGTRASDKLVERASGLFVAASL